MPAGLPSERFEVQTLAISMRTYRPLLGDYKLVDIRASPTHGTRLWVQILRSLKKARKKSNDRGTEKKTGNTMTWERGEGKSLEQQRGVCSMIKDRRR